MTPLHRAVAAGQSEGVALLLRNGAKVNRRCKVRASLANLPGADWPGNVQALCEVKGYLQEWESASLFAGRAVTAARCRSRPPQGEPR